jgi:hypothetical protein
MDNQRDKQYISAPENKYPRAELSVDNNLFFRDKRLEELIAAKHHADEISDYITRDIDKADAWLDAAVGEIERLQREIRSHGPEGRNYTNQQYVDLRTEVSQLREDKQKLIDALIDISDLGTSSNYTANVAVLTAREALRALGIGE